MLRPIAFFLGAALAVFASACGGHVTGPGGAAGQGASAGSSGAAGNGGTAGSGNAGGSAGAAGSGDFTSCDSNTQCVLAAAGCCSPCSTEDLSLYAAIDSAKFDAYFKAVCPQPTPCPACDPQMNPNFFAYCDAGKCRAADVREHPVSECATPADCTLRIGSSCCEGCASDPYQVIAVSTTAMPTLGALVCVGDVLCPECAPQYPPGTAASCSMDGHCEVIMVPGP